MVDENFVEGGGVVGFGFGTSDSTFNKHNN